MRKQKVVAGGPQLMNFSWKQNRKNKKERTHLYFGKERKTRLAMRLKYSTINP
jgi:hypothetical protein